MHQKTFLTLLVLFSFLSSTNAADPSVLAIYGEGVHSFYVGGGAVFPNNNIHNCIGGAANLNG